MRTLFFLLFFTCLFFSPGKISAQSPTTKGTDFWLGFLENLTLTSNGAPVFAFEISSDVNTIGTISLPSTGYSQTFTVTAGQVTEALLPVGIFYTIGSEAIGTTALHVTSNDPINLSVQHNRLYFSDATIVLPNSELGDRYMVTSHTPDANSGGFSEFLVVATEDNTVIDITPSMLTLGLRPIGIPFSVTLSRGQVYQVQSYSEVTGSTITAHDGKKIAVFSGVSCGSVQCGATNHLYDEAYPISDWGNEYMTIPFVPFAYDYFKVLASENGTLVYFNCNPPIMLNKGEYYDTVMFQPTRITSNHPVALSQFKLGQSCSTLGDASFLMYKPLAFCSHKVAFESITNAAPGNPYTFHCVNVLTKTANTSLVLVDNATVTFYPIPSNPSYSYAYVVLNAGSHTLVSDSGFYANAFGAGQYDSYSYFLGYDAMCPSSSSLTAQGTDTLCSGTQGTFTATSTSSVSSWNWEFGDGGTSTQQNPSYTFNQNGNYTATVFAVDGTGCPAIASVPVLVNTCDEGFDCELFVPTAFSPNHDGINDSIGVYGICLKEMEFTIYDRWGEIVFQSNDQAKFWDGTYKGQPMDNSVFAWVLKATSYSGSQVSRKGNITLVK